MTSLLIRNGACVVTMDDEGTEHRDTDIRIEHGEIVDLGQGLEASGPVIDAGGCLVTPGLVNTHHHLFQTLTRAVPGAQDAALFGWLGTLYPIWARFTPEHMFVSAQAGLEELALSGCTMTPLTSISFPTGCGSTTRSPRHGRSG
ncbi:MAG: hydroxyatrazine ethylaminohydrolase AtzB [Rhodobacteraceae bacterium HLUCCO18]|nr:MAG: hydroxyatrazine ethylaminohydrolase AtzB [Rhodobacteraceae bacterium HLUCCO18]